MNLNYNCTTLTISYFFLFSNNETELQVLHNLKLTNLCLDPWVQFLISLANRRHTICILESVPQPETFVKTSKTLPILHNLGTSQGLLKFLQSRNKWDTHLMVLYKINIEDEFWDVLKTISSFYLSSNSEPYRDNTFYHFLIWPGKQASKEYICTKILSQMNQYLKHLKLDSNLFILYQTSLFTSIQLLEIYSVKNETKCHEITHSPNHHADTIPRKLVRRQDFGGTVISATTAIDNTMELEIKLTEFNGTIIDANGFAGGLYKDLGQTLNFTFKMIKGDWVNRNSSTGQLDGISVKQLNNGSADIYITQTTFVAFRAQGFNYLQPTFQDNMNAFFRQPSTSSVRNVHTEVFDSSVWFMIFTTWFVLCISKYQISKINHSQKKSNENGVQRNNLEKFQEALLWVIGSGCTQGWYKVPKSLSHRIVLLSGAICGLVIYVTYSGAIISALTTEIIPIRNIIDLIKSPLGIYVDRDSSTLRQVVEHLRVNYSSLRPSSNYEYIDETNGVLHVLHDSSPSALFGFTRNFYNEIVSSKIDPRLVCEKVSQVPIQKLSLLNGMLVPKWSPFREIFNYKIIQLKERGLNQRYVEHFLQFSTNMKNCGSKKEGKKYRENLGLYDTFLAFEIFMIGSVIAIGIFTIEKFYCKFQLEKVYFKNLFHRLNNR